MPTPFRILVADDDAGLISEFLTSALSQPHKVSITCADNPIETLILLKLGSFDLIFLDPPYGEGWLTRLLPDARTLVAPGGCVYVEAEAPLDQILAADATLQASFEVLRADKAGQVFYYLLRRKN